MTAALLFPAGPAGARAASTFTIRGGGDGHGIGMSQYGAYGYALHGATYQFILEHYYQGTSLGTTNPNRTVRVLLATGSASVSGATAATAPGSGRTALRAATTYDVVEAGGGQLALRSPSGATVGTFAAPLTVSGPAPLQVPGLGTYRGSLVFSPSGGGVQTVNAVGLDDYVRRRGGGRDAASWARGRAPGPGGRRPHLRDHRHRRRRRLRRLLRHPLPDVRRRPRRDGRHRRRRGVDRAVRS